MSYGAGIRHLELRVHDLENNVDRLEASIDGLEDCVERLEIRTRERQSRSDDDAPGER
jgi:exonuclease VII small subunit